MRREIVLAGGCFWGVEKYIASFAGVLDTQVGYANGRTDCPSYEQVCRENTGHAEAVKVSYDDQTLPLEELLRRFFEVIDPTSVNRQGNDVGSQYRTGIYYADDGDRPAVEAALAALQTQYDRPLAVEKGPLENYCPAEDYHQDYLDKNPGGYCHIHPAAFEKYRGK